MRVKLQGRNYIFPENLSKLDVNKSKFGFIGTPLIIERYAPNLSLLFPPSLQCQKTTTRDDE